MATTTLAQLTKDTKVFLPDSIDGFIGAVISHVERHSDDKLTLTLVNENGKEIRLDVSSGSKDLPALRNPPILEAVDDLTNLSYLNEPSVLHTIRTRYAQRQIYTYSGIVLIATNPFAAVTLYGQEMIQAHAGRKKGELEPHLFAIAEDAYRCMIRDAKNQTIIVSGESGAGKTVSAKYIMRYFATVDDPEKPSSKKRKVVGKSGMSETEEQILATNPIMEAFGNAKTTRNDNSSRFGKYIEILFDRDQNIVGAKMRTYLLERSRLVFQPEAERNYHIFYQLLAGAPASERKALDLKPPSAYKYLQGVASIKGVDEVKEFEATQRALSTVGITVTTQWQIFSILAALLHLGNVEIKAMRNDALLDDDEANLALAARLLQIDVNEMKKWLVKRKITTRNETIVSNVTQAQAINVRDAVAKHIYAHLFDWLVTTMNASLAKPSSSDGEESQVQSFIGVLDIYGFEHFQQNSFEQFCINYANEKLQQEFNSHVFKLEQEEYIKEKIDWTFIDFADNQPTIDLIEGKLGILSLLDEESRLPSGSDQSWVQKLHNSFGQEKYSQVFKKPKFGQSAFTVCHYALDVSYECHGFLEKNRDTVPDEILACLAKTENPFLKEVMEAAKMDETAPSSVPKDPKRGGVTRKATLGSTFKGSLISLMATIDSTNAHYIRCIKPNEAKEAWKLESPMVLSQLRACGVLETIRISCLGYPSRWTYEEFGERYYMLINSSNWNAKASTLAESVLSKTITGADKYQKGLTKIFFRAGMLAFLENLRSQRLKECALTMQKVLRGNLHRQRFLRLRTVAFRLQAQWRGIAARRALLAQKKEKCAIALQRYARRHLEMSRLRKAREAAVKIQALIRGRVARTAFTDRRRDHAAIRIQSFLRCRLSRKSYLDHYRKIVIAQSAVRRHAARKELKTLKVEARSVNHFKEVSFKMETKLVQLTQSLQERVRENKAMQSRLDHLENDLKMWQTKHAESAAEVDVLKQETKAVAATTVPRADFEELQRAKSEIEIQYEECVKRLQAQDEEVELLYKDLDTKTQELAAVKPRTNGHVPTGIVTNGTSPATSYDPQGNDPALVRSLKQELNYAKEQIARLQEGQDPIMSRERPDGQMHLTNGGHVTTELHTNGLGIANGTNRNGYLQHLNKQAAGASNQTHLEGAQDAALLEEIFDFLESDVDLEHDVVDGLIRDNRIVPPLSDSAPASKDVFFPAHIIGLITGHMWRGGLLHSSERFLASVMQTIQNHIMAITGEEAIVPGIFWMSNVHELLSYMHLAENELMSGTTELTKSQLDEFGHLVSLVQHDLESLEYNIHLTWLRETKKVLNKMVAAALIGSQALPGFVTNDSGRFFGRILPGSNAQPTHTMDDVLGLLNTVWLALKNFHVEHEICQMVIVELLRMVGIVSFNDLLMRRNFCSWKRAMQIQYNLTRIEEWCKSIDMPEGNLQLEHLMQATKLLQLKKSTLGDIEIIYDVCWMLTPTQIQKLISQYYTADYENPISPEILKYVAAKVDPHDSHDSLLLEPMPLDDAGPFETPMIRPLEQGLIPYAPNSVNAPRIRHFLDLLARSA